MFLIFYKRHIYFKKLFQVKTKNVPAEKELKKVSEEFKLLSTKGITFCKVECILQTMMIIKSF